MRSPGAALYFIANRGAYKGYFSGDDLDNLSWTSNTGPVDFVKGVLSFLNSLETISDQLGTSIFWRIGRTARLHFRPYVVLLQLFHLLNGFLLWWTVRKLEAQRLGGTSRPFFSSCFTSRLSMLTGSRCTSSMFSAEHFACCLCHLHRTGGGLLSLLCFWLAYKAKEVAVMLPVVLLCLRIPCRSKTMEAARAVFSAITLVSACRHVFANAAAKGAYKLHFTPGRLRDTFVILRAVFCCGSSAALIAILLLLILVRVVGSTSACWP